MADEYDRESLAEQVGTALRKVYRGNKRSAYTAAGVSPQTFNRALAQHRLREDKRLAIEGWLDGLDGASPEAGYVTAPGEKATVTITEEDPRPVSFLLLSGVAMCSYVCQCWAMPATATTVEVNGYALRELRVRSGIGVADLAKSVGVQRPYIAKIELGHSRRVSPKVYSALLSALAITDRRVLMANPHGVDGEAVA